MNLGSTFVNVATPTFPSHLWFVVSHIDGANRVVIVNISSTDRGLGDLEVLNIGDHAWILHDSFIRTDMAMLSPIAAIRAALAATPAAVIAQAAATAATVTKLQRALRDSRHTRLDVKRTLQEQGLA